MLTSILPKRRFRLHRFSWVVLSLSTLAMLLITVPGVYVSSTLLDDHPIKYGADFLPFQDPSHLEGPIWVAEYSHGWPWPYLRRAQGFGGKGWPKQDVGDDPFSEPLIAPNGIIVWWSVPGAWPFSSDASVWNLTLLFADAIVALLFVVGLTFVCEFWLRRRGGLGRFRIVDFLLVVAASAALLGWSQYNLHEAKVEKKAIATLKEAGCLNEDAFFSDETERVGFRAYYQPYTGPDWLRRLVGSSEFLKPTFYRITKLAIKADEMEQAEWNAIANLKHLEVLEIYGEVSISRKREFELRIGAIQYHP